jgi:CBS-domain-containing membrane protein
MAKTETATPHLRSVANVATHNVGRAGCDHAPGEGDQDVREAAQLMESQQVRRVPVLDRSKRLVGIVSLGDLATDARDDRLTGEVLERVSEPAEPDR